jgi:DNA-binding CsgD family transcriptional regulator
MNSSVRPQVLSDAGSTDHRNPTDLPRVVMHDAIIDGTCVSICDRRGQVIWRSGREAIGRPGNFAWQYLSKESVEKAKLAFAKVVSLREETSLEMENRRGKHFRAWLWPLDQPDIAVCILSVSIPRQLKDLTTREREILGLLAMGRTTKEIAEELDISASTVHTHLRRSRDKLSMTTVEALIGFAARFCHPKAAPLQMHL